MVFTCNYEDHSGRIFVALWIQFLQIWRSKIKLSQNWIHRKSQKWKTAQLHADDHGNHGMAHGFWTLLTSNSQVVCQALVYQLIGEPARYPIVDRNMANLAESLGFLVPPSQKKGIPKLLHSWVPTYPLPNCLGWVSFYLGWYVSSLEGNLKGFSLVAPFPSNSWSLEVESVPLPNRLLSNDWSHWVATIGWESRGMIWANHENAKVKSVLKVHPAAIFGWIRTWISTGM